jgi:hypothetical protein
LFNGQGREIYPSTCHPVKDNPLKFIVESGDNSTTFYVLPKSAGDFPVATRYISLNLFVVKSIAHDK